MSCKSRQRHCPEFNLPTINECLGLLIKNCKRKLSKTVFRPCRIPLNVVTFRHIFVKDCLQEQIFPLNSSQRPSNFNIFEILCIQAAYNLVSSLFYINESLVLAVKNYAKTDIEVVWSCSVCFFKKYILLRIVVGTFLLQQICIASTQVCGFS